MCQNAPEQPRAEPPTTAVDGLQRLLAIMTTLRDPQHGCPWDIAQTSQSIAHYAIEEAYELEQAIRDHDDAAIQGELGDLLLQVVFHAQMASEAGKFDFYAIAEQVADKMIRRHPHVFRQTNEDQFELSDWETIKAKERVQRGETGLLADVPVALPALIRATKLQKRAARVGFDWDNSRDVMDKIHEELGELEAEVTANDQDKLEAELGDLLFSIANAARHFGINPENALRRTNQKFTTRFEWMETQQGSATLGTLSIDELEQLWQQAKARE